MTKVTAAPIASTVKGLSSQVPVVPAQGLEHAGLTWLIVGRLGCWGLVVGGIVRVAWVEVRTNVGV